MSGLEKVIGGPGPGDPPPPLKCRHCDVDVPRVWIGATVNVWSKATICEACMCRESVREAADAIEAEYRRRCVGRVDTLIPPKYRDADLLLYRCPPGDARARETVAAWWPTKKHGLYIYGERGTGKTHLMYARLRSVIYAPLAWTDHNLDALYVSVLPLLAAAQFEAVARELRMRRAEAGMPLEAFRVAAYEAKDLLRELAQDELKTGMAQGAVMDALRRVCVLAIDDLAATMPNRLERDCLWTLLDSRYRALLPTLITSEKSPRMLAEGWAPPDDPGFGDRLASRICDPDGGCQPVEVKAKDYRIEALKAARAKGA